MALLLPTVAVESVLDITPSILRAMRVDTVLLDVDNTLAIHGSQTPFEGTVEWSRRLRKEGFRIIIVSNNIKDRVAPFAAQYDLPFLHFSLKPFPVAYYRAMRRLGAHRRDVVVVGDQIFTDVVGANLALMKSILLTPCGKESSVSFRIRRAFEKPLRNRIQRTARGSQYLHSDTSAGQKH